MSEKRWNIKYYTTSRGDAPVFIFLSSLAEKSRAKIVHTIALLQEYGPIIQPPYAKKLQPNLWELRSSGKEPIRVLYTKYKQVFYLLHIFKKKTNKTPRKEINTALDRINELYNI